MTTSATPKLPLQNVCTSQPQSPVGIDWANPLTKGLIGLINGSRSGFKGDMVTNSPAPQATGPRAYQSGESFGGLTTGVAYPRLNAGAKNWDITSPVMSMFAAYHPTANGSSSNIASNGLGTSSGFAIYSHFSNGTPRFVIYEAGGVAKTVTGSTGDIKLNRLNTGCVTSDGSNVCGYQNGTLIGTTATTGANLNYDATYHRVALGGSAQDSGGLAGCAVHYAGLWNRALSAAEIKSLSNNPWQVFKAPDQNYFVPTATTSASTTITGISITSGIGALTAQGAAIATLGGVSASSSVGILGVTTSAAITLSGVTSTSNVGIISASANGSGSTTLVGVTSTNAIGNITAVGSRNATTTLSGVLSSSNVGTLNVSVSVATTLGGVGSTASVGVVTGTGIRNASTTLAGQSATSNRGNITAYSSALVTLNGVIVNTAVGSLNISAGASATLPSVLANVSVGNVNADGNFPYTISLRYYYSEERNNVFVPDSKNNVFAPDSRDVQTIPSPSRNQVFVSNTRTKVFVSPKRDT